MPNYRYQCPTGHVFEKRAGYDDDSLPCDLCDAPSRRLAVYRDQSVIFAGPGWTRSVQPPPEPLPPSTEGQSADTHFERLDQYAKEQYHDEINTRPYRKESARREAKGKAGSKRGKSVPD